MSQPLRLYGLHTSRCTQIARFALNEKKVPFQYVRVNSPEHLARHPLGKIPALEVQGKYYFESIAICRYIDAISTPSLVPADPVAALAVNQWVEGFIYNFYPYAFIIKTAAQRDAADTTSAADNIASAKTHLTPILAAYEKQLANGCGYLAGSEFSLADVVHMPYLNVLVKAVPELIQGRVREWFDRIAERPAWKEVLEFEANEPAP
ncbi:hypothetical protein HDU87_004415 [Geranomyces variabilis]|uniref:glutathione transferase n=1 Tax=Geranomyces variabilis TaxID=109894 RepID=A0AAD5TJH7_9FUNG|nr:hypothetical protein HDU87_004415 [Geranomyces variabilis]